MELIDGEKEIILENVNEILNSTTKTRENLIPILQQVQKRIGYLPALAMEYISESIGIPAVDIYSLATFYNQFRLTPPGKNRIKVCMGTACYMVGGQIALDSFERRLNIHEGETTPDREYSLEHVACVGSVSYTHLDVYKRQSLTMQDMDASTGRKSGPIIAGIVSSAANPYWFLWWATIGAGYVAFSCLLYTSLS